MGNSKIKDFKIDNFLKYENDIIISPINSELDKKACEEEKSKLKLVKKHNKEKQDSHLIDDSMLDHFFLRALEKDARIEVIKEMSLYYAKQGLTIFKEGAPSGFFYLLRQGNCEIFLKGQKIKTLGKGDCFGDTSLIYNTNRDYTVTASTDSFFWTMEKRNFKKIVEHITHITYDDNSKSVQNLPIFSILTHAQKTKIINNIFRETRYENQPIYNIDNVANAIYVVKDGKVAIKYKDEVVKMAIEGDFFGELSVLGLTNRFTEAIATVKTHLYSVSTFTLQKLYGENYRSVLLLSLIKTAFCQTRNFQNINLKFVDDIFHLFKFVFCENEKEVIKKGEYKNNYIIIPIGGDLYEVESNKRICRRNNLLFDEEIYHDIKTPTNSAIRTSKLCLVAIANKNEVTKQFKCSFKEIIFKSAAIEQLKLVRLFKNFSDAKFENLAGLIKVKKIPDKQNVITQGEEGDDFYIIKSGLVDIYVRGKYIRTMNENEYLGERALFFKEPRTATATAHGDCEVYYLTKKDFEKVITENLQKYLIERIYLQDESIQLSELTYFAKLGSGSFGNVTLVKSNKNKKIPIFYAIKNISNKQILYEQIHHNLELERAILLKIDHPFIVKLVKSLKDEKYVYFLMDFIKGKELFDVIRDIGLLNKVQTQFYGASVMLAVNYLHEKKFVFRDIKPENIMIGKNGYIKLIDFGTAKFLENDRTKTVIGTPHYMAPEIIRGEGYSFQVDFWSIAICMYEFICGCVPFGDNTDQTMEVYMSILNEQLTFPDYVTDRDFKSLMKQMLNKNLANRCCKFEQISSHIWFKDFNWDDLISLNMTPAYIPKIDELKAKDEPRPYLEYVKSLPDWEVPEGKAEPSEKNKRDFKEWLQKF